MSLGTFSHVAVLTSFQVRPTMARNLIMGKYYCGLSHVHSSAEEVEQCNKMEEERYAVKKTLGQGPRKKVTGKKSHGKKSQENVTEKVTGNVTSQKKKTSTLFICTYNHLRRELYIAHSVT